MLGKYNPAGRLPITFYKSIDDILAFDDYSMKGKTYRYVTKPVLYPFGYGLSYTTFVYSQLKLSSKILSSKSTLKIDLTIKNTDNYDGDEVVQLYIKHDGIYMPIKELKGFKRIHLTKGAEQMISFNLKGSDIQHYNSKIDDLGIIPGKIQLFVGSSSTDAKLIGNFELKL